MKTPRIANAIGHIDDDLVTDAAKCKKKIKTLVKWGSLAACFAVIVIVGAAILPSLFRENVTPEGTNGRYKDFSIQASESAIVWPCEYQTVYENIEMSKLTVLSIMEKAVLYQKHWLARALETTLLSVMMKSMMERNILPSLKYTSYRISLKVSL